MIKLLKVINDYLYVNDIILEAEQDILQVIHQMILIIMKIMTYPEETKKN